jgi:hypothetical protein
MGSYKSEIATQITFTHLKFLKSDSYEIGLARNPIKGANTFPLE